jgi:hypothetical protein
MALTTLDTTTALLVVDLQKGIVGMTPGQPIAEMVGRARTLIDAMADRRPEAHDYSIRNVFPRLGESGTSQEIIDLLQTSRV